MGAAFPPSEQKVFVAPRGDQEWLHHEAAFMVSHSSWELTRLARNGDQVGSPFLARRSAQRR